MEELVVEGRIWFYADFGDRGGFLCWPDYFEGYIAYKDSIVDLSTVRKEWRRNDVMLYYLA